MGERDERGHAGRLVLLTVLSIVLYERSMALLFAFCLDTLGLNPALLLAVLLLSGFAYPLGLARLWPHSRPLVAACWLGLAGLVGLALADSTVLAVLGAFGGLAAATPLWMDATARRPRSAVTALAVGVAVHATLRIVNDTASLLATGLGRAVLGLAIAGAVIAAVRSGTRGDARDSAAPGLAVLPALYALLLAQPLFVGIPWSQVVFRSAGESWLRRLVAASGDPLLGPDPFRFWMAARTLGMDLGLALGLLAAWAAWRRARTPSFRLPAALFAAGWLGLLFDDSTLLGPLWVLLAQAGAILGVAGAVGPSAGSGPASDAPPGGSRRSVSAIGLRVGLVQVATLASVLLFGMARLWPFIPEPLGPTLAGGQLWGFGLGGALFLLFAWVARRGEVSTAGADPLAGSLEASGPDATPRGGVPANAVTAVVIAALVAVAWIGWGGRWASAPVAGSSEDARAGDEIALLTYNVQLFLAQEPIGRVNLEPLLGVLADDPAEVIALQETDTATLIGGHQIGPYWLARRLGSGYRYHYGAATIESTPGVALLTSLEVGRAEYEILPFTTSIPRAALLATLESPGVAFDVAVVHIQWTEPGLPGDQTSEWKDDQTRQTERLLELVAASPRAVILGDVNAGPGHPGPAYDLLEARYDDAWVAAGNRVDDPRGHTSTAARPEKRIDLIYLSRAGWRVVAGSAMVLGDAATSDHRAVRVEAERSE